MAEEGDKKNEFRVSGEDLLRKVKDLIREGNIRRIIIKDEQGKTYLEIPLTFGVVGVVLAPVLAAIGALAAPQQTLEELHLLQKLLRGFGSGNVDFRLRQSDFSSDGKLAGIPWLGMSITDFAQLDRVLVVGSTLRWGMQFKLLPELPEMVAYVDRLKQRPALQRQLARDQEIAQRTSA